MNEKNEKTISKIRIAIYYLLHMLLTAACGAGVAWFSNEVILENAWNDKYFICAGVLLAAIAFCSLLEWKKIYTSIRSVILLFICFLISAFLLLSFEYYVSLPIWLLGGIAAAALVNRGIGILYLYYFIYHAVYLQGNWINGLVFHFVAATLIAFLIPKMKSFRSMLYMMAFTVCIVVTGSVLYNRMLIDTDMIWDTLYVLGMYLACILVTMLLVKWLGKTESAASEAVQDGVTEESTAEVKAEEVDAATAVTEAAAAETEIPETETIPEVDYTPYCNEKSELLLELSTRNKSSYAQAVLLGKLASETAKSIGLDEKFVKAAGLYKKIGKIHEDNNEYTSTEIAKEHHFPELLVDLIDQLNRNKIEQKEAAVLLLTEGVISYYSIVRTHKTDIPVEKIVDTIVSQKIFQGELNSSDLSVQECFLLREKLINLLKAQDKKRAAK